MLTVEPHGANRLDLTLDGKLDTEGMKAALDSLMAKSEGMEHGKMLYRINEFRVPTFGALAVEFSRVPSLFRLARRFDRVAVLADKEWIQKVGEIEGALMPGLTVKGFDLDESDDAERWLEET